MAIAYAYSFAPYSPWLHELGIPRVYHASEKWEWMNYLIYISPVKPGCQAQEGNIRLSLMFRPYGAERKSDTDGVKTWRVPAQLVSECVFGVGMHLQCESVACSSPSSHRVRIRCEYASAMPVSVLFFGKLCQCFHTGLTRVSITIHRV